MTHEPGKGISFTNMLLLLAHHKLIVDREALVLKDLVRNETLKLVTDLVDFDRVQSPLLMISHRRRYLASLRKERMRQGRLQEEGNIPAIIVDNPPSTPPPQMTPDITSRGQDRSPEMDSASRRPSLYSPEVSFALDSQGASSLHRSRRISDISMLLEFMFDVDFYRLKRTCNVFASVDGRGQEN
ncbi:hypothetical protein K474DRAFT_1063693 [Panus rudis PR-1116 ss-1]|nr:hypothetical protein K474DRAFT_1063693 [Panus rudis PR-1116 ss-1]